MLIAQARKCNTSFVAKLTEPRNVKFPDLIQGIQGEVLYLTCKEGFELLNETALVIECSKVLYNAYLWPGLWAKRLSQILDHIMIHS